MINKKHVLKSLIMLSGTMMLLGVSTPLATHNVKPAHAKTTVIHKDHDTIIIKAPHGSSADIKNDAMDHSDGKDFALTKPVTTKQFSYGNGESDDDTGGYSPSMSTQEVNKWALLYLSHIKNLKDYNWQETITYADDPTDNSEATASLTFVKKSNNLLDPNSSKNFKLSKLITVKQFSYGDDEGNNDSETESMNPYISKWIDDYLDHCSNLKDYKYKINRISSRDTETGSIMFVKKQ